jgi:hypothetical protein
MAKEERMDRRGQRSPLPAGCDVAGTKIGDGRNARSLGDHGRFRDL